MTSRVLKVVSACVSIAIGSAVYQALRDDPDYAKAAVVTIVQSIAIIMYELLYGESTNK